MLKELGDLDYFLGFILPSRVQLRPQLDKWGPKTLSQRNEGLRASFGNECKDQGVCNTRLPTSQLTGLYNAVTGGDLKSVGAGTLVHGGMWGRTNLRAQGLPLCFSIAIRLIGSFPICLSYVVKTLEILITVFNTEWIPEASL